MKMGNILSPWRYDNRADDAIGTTAMRTGCRGCAPIFGLEAIGCRWHIMPYRTDIEQLERTPMPTRNVVLTEHQADLIETLVESGRYQNASEVLRDGLRLVEQREAEDASKLKTLRAAARVGVSALDRGEFKEFKNSEDLQAYLNDLSEKVISKAAG
jgi:antitoxin ParD1/3/4